MTPSYGNARKRFAVVATALVAALLPQPLLFATPPADRSTYAQQTVVNPVTGEMTAAPASYANLGAADRSAYAQQTTVNSATGEMTAEPATYASVGAPDRSTYAQQTTVDPATGETTAEPASYADVDTPDRIAYGQQTTIDPSSGELMGEPAAYADTDAPNRTAFGQQTTVDGSGEMTDEPDSYDVYSIHPVPDGSFGTAMRAARVGALGTQVNVTWDVATCTSGDYHLLYGNLSSVSSYALAGGACALGTTGSASWLGVPSGNTWFVVVGDDDSGTEASWGTRTGGTPLGGSTPSNQCGNTTRDNGKTCP